MAFSLVEPLPGQTEVPVELDAVRKDVGSFDPSLLPGRRKLLGQRDEDVPESVHTEMERMAREGIIPVSNLTQRQRCRKSTSTIAVPLPLMTARNFGYLHPNLPAPSGHVWRFVANGWFMGLRGG